MFSLDLRIGMCTQARAAAMSPPQFRELSSQLSKGTPPAALQHPWATAGSMAMALGGVPWTW